MQTSDNAAGNSIPPALSNVISSHLYQRDGGMKNKMVIYGPAVSSTGKIEEELKSAGRKYKVGKCQFVANGRAKITDDAEGFV
ncbi:Uncharacterized protein BM_BM9625 [Brugia malayi]|uniref:Bm9625 n=1 Tax=Brugia malayi TaxID=6279 RepID=A0A0K0JZX7_BRUMA|nr:Uncharacterized protein BM_BM9625 [Brugia malayi]CDP94723.1 Bm9625 [Brugia malayi]VIO86898.1 Uncharacterized protein BM_BM9625 [Brugia malayi]